MPLFKDACVRWLNSSCGASCQSQCPQIQLSYKSLQQNMYCLKCTVYCLNCLCIYFLFQDCSSSPSKNVKHKTKHLGMKINLRWHSTILLHVCVITSVVVKYGEASIKALVFEFMCARCRNCFGKQNLQMYQIYHSVVDVINLCVYLSFGKCFKHILCVMEDFMKCNNNYANH